MVDRRGLLAGAGAGALVLAGCGGGADEAGPPEERRNTSREGDVELLRSALSLELADVKSYERLRASLRGEAQEMARRFERVEQEHRDRLAGAIRALGGDTRVSSDFVEPDDPPDSETALRELMDVEANAIAFYIDMIPKVYEAELRAVVASILTVEAEQLAVLRALGALPPAPDPFVYGLKRA